MHLGSQRFKNTETDREKEDKKAKERAETCNASRSTLAKYKKAPFLYRYDDEKKQKVRLSKEESEDAMLQAKKDVSYWCDNVEKEYAEEEKTADDEQQEISQNNPQE